MYEWRISMTIVSNVFQECLCDGNQIKIGTNIMFVFLFWPNLYKRLCPFMHLNILYWLPLNMCDNMDIKLIVVVQITASWNT